MQMNQRLLQNCLVIDYFLFFRILISSWSWWAKELGGLELVKYVYPTFLLFSFSPHFRIKDSREGNSKSLDPDFDISASKVDRFFEFQELCRLNDLTFDFS